MRKNVKTTPHSARYEEAAKLIDADKLYTVAEAIELAKKTSNTKKLTQGVDIAIRLGIDPRKSDQNVRGTTNIPHGTGKTKTVAVLAGGDLAQEARDAGADIVGDEDLIKKVQEGWKAFDVMLATPDMAPQIGKIGRMLGPKTPNKRNGTVTDKIAQAVQEIKGATRVEYRAEKGGIVHMPIGKVSFTDEQLIENFNAALVAIIRAKPATSKGKYIVGITLSTTMGPGIKIESATAAKQAGH